MPARVLVRRAEQALSQFGPSGESVPMPVRVTHSFIGFAAGSVLGTSLAALAPYGHASPAVPAASGAARAATAVVLGSTGAQTAVCYDDALGNIESVATTTLATIHYNAPSDGVLTSFSYQAASVPSSSAKVRALVLRLGTGGTLSVVGKSALESPVANQLNTFPTRLTMQANDVLALNIKGVAFPGVACTIGPSGAARISLSDVDSGSTVSGGSVVSGVPDISGLLEPDADRDGYGDLSQDGCPIAAAISGACPVPQTVVIKRPRNKTSSHRVKIVFSSTVEGSTFLCRLDSKQTEPCSSPLRIRARLGRHRVYIQATSSLYATSEATPAKVSWKVVKPPRRK